MKNQFEQRASATLIVPMSEGHWTPIDLGPSRFLTSTEVARIRRMSEGALRVERCLTPQRSPPFFKMPNGRVLYWSADLEAWLSRSRVPEVM